MKKLLFIFMCILVLFSGCGQQTFVKDTPWIERKTVKMDPPDDADETAYHINDDRMKPISTYRVTSLFGYREDPISGKLSFHRGVDLAAAKGTDIFCAMDGVIREAKWDKYYGYYLIVQHEDNVETVYGHCEKLLVSAGDHVKKGTLIAKVGSTGYSTGFHLHFEIRIDGICRNPTYIYDF